jgi:uncharacterized membrane protein
VKLILQIALGVFLGTLISQVTIDNWHIYQEKLAKSEVERQKAAQEKLRTEQGEQIRKILLQGRQNNAPTTRKPPEGFVPDDAQ